ncbi:MAG TPA: hypothetical protein VGK33_16640, partial [Chloroflexota bacterium]
MRLALLASLFLTLGTGCVMFEPSPLGQVSARPPAISPLVRDQTNRLDVLYHLNTPASVSSRIVSGDGQQWTIASGAWRPTPGDYVLQFDGTVAGPGANERRVLPDGDYQLILDVQGAAQQQQVPVTLTVRGADTSLPTVSNLSLLPDHISPNFQALNDTTHMTYSLGKDAMVSPFLDTVPDSAPPTRVWTGEEVKTSAGAQSLTWDGTANGQPVPDGQCMLGIRARDVAGNIIESSQPIVVEDSGVPQASLVAAQIGPLQIIRGDQVCLDAIVQNTGQTVLRTQGPDPGYVYNSLDDFSTIDNHAYA